MNLTLQTLSSATLSALLVAGLTGCAFAPDTESDPAGAEEIVSNETVEKPTTQSCPTWVSASGWHRSTKQPGYLCYYAEMTQCGTSLFAYNKRVSTGVLITWSGLQFAYACQLAVVGERYNGQWAIGSSAGPVTSMVFSSWSGITNNPRVDPSSAY